jgi:predicted DNA-binding protein (MmcQ/YjbR family)
MNIEQLRTLCLSLPHTTEDVKWEKDLCFCVGSKMFCVTGLEDGHEGASFKVKDEQFGELTSRPGIEPAPYLARYKWILTRAWDSLDEQEWEQFVRQSYQLVFDKLSGKVKQKISPLS